MQITLDPNFGRYTIRSYIPGEILINDLHYQHSIIITPDEIIDPWPPHTFSEVTVNDLQMLLSFNPEVVLLGTGIKQQFLPPQLQAMFYTQKVGIEIMDSGAACRTYNVLISGGRKVVAGLLIR